MRFLQILLALVIVISGSTFGQPSLEQRTTDYLRQYSPASFLSATRYAPIVLGRGYGTWSSPGARIALDGIPFDAFLLNLSSPDYVPFDVILADSIDMTLHPSISGSGNFPGGMILLKRSEISDSLVIVGRLYGGSETGDVILQEYTRDNLPFYNRNKIGFSGAAAISDRIGGFAYRIMGGGYSYFSVGYAERDRILIPYIDLATFSQPNRNYIGSLELEFGKDLSVFAGFNAFEAWEQAPFLPTFAFFSGALGTVRISARDLVSTVDLVARRDASSVTMRGQFGTAGGHYESSVAALNPIVRLIANENLKISLPFEFAAHAVDVHDQNKQLFDRDLDRTTWSLGLNAALAYRVFRGGMRASFEKGLNGSYLRSGEISVRMEPVFGSLELHASSVERSPSLLEMYGTFSTWRFRPVLAGNDTFRVAGAASLKPARSSGVEARFEHNGSLGIGIAIFYSMTEDLITRRPLSIIRSAVPGDLVFSGRYENAPRRVFGGADISIRSAWSSETSMEIRYSFTENLKAPEIPRHQVIIKNSVRLAALTTGSVSVRGSARTSWPEFAVDPSQDDYAGIGSDGVVGEYWTVDCSIVQNLGTIWFAREVDARIELQNIFNRTFRTIPIGVTSDFAVIGFLSVRL